MYKVTNEYLRGLRPITCQLTRGLRCIPANNPLANSCTSNLQHMRQEVLVNSILQLIGLALHDYADTNNYLSKGWKASLKMKKGSLRIPLLVRITICIEGKCAGTINESVRNTLSTINLSPRALIGSWDKGFGTTLDTTQNFTITSISLGT